MNSFQCDAWEHSRRVALASYEVLDTKSERAFDDLTELIATVCQTPIALISLVDKDRQWFKARIGLEARQTAREVAFCDHTIRQPGPMVVADARQDARFRDNPLVTADPNIRFYAGSPLIDQQGHALGTLCVIDRQPRDLTHQQLTALECLSRQVVHLLELRRSHRQLASNLARVRSIAEMVPICSHCHAIRDNADEWQRVEHYFHNLNGTQFTHGVCPACMIKCYPDDLGIPSGLGELHTH